MISKSGERKTFRLYCLYGFGVPTLLTAVALFMDYMSPEYVAPYLAPRFGEETCFLRSNNTFIFVTNRITLEWIRKFLVTVVTGYVYLYLPIMLILISNSIFFALTALKIRRVQAEIKGLIANDSIQQLTDLKQAQAKWVANVIVK